MKILILVLSFDDNSIYSQFYKTQKETWDSDKVGGVETFYYFGNSNENKIIGNNIYVDVVEELYNCGHKTIKTFELIKNFDFDYVFRTNSSSYIDKKMLLDFIQDKPKNKYCGAVIGNYNSTPFPSGCGYFLSKDLINLIIEESNIWDHHVIDDVAVGKILLKNNIPISLNQRFDVYQETNIPTNYFHYRLKNNDRTFDIQTMYKIKKNKDEFYNRK